MLLAEDNDALAANIAEYLEQAGDVIDFARDGEGSLHLARTNAYDAIVLDLTSPLLDGLGVARRLRERAGITTPSSCSPRVIRCRTSWRVSTPAPAA